MISMQVILVTEQFNEQSTFGIVGPIPNDINDHLHLHLHN